MADEARKGREGSRWINERPSGEDLAAWFQENVDIAEGLKHEDYVQGVTLIPQREKSREVVGFSNENKAIIQEVENLVYIPYAKVETRVKYFHDLMAQHDEWFGVIEPVEVEGGKSKGYPPGFFSIEVPQTKSNTKPARFFCCTMRVRIYKADTVREERIVLNNGRESSVQFRRTGDLILDAPPATKMVSALGRYGEADPFAMMKAETGAVGRALGLAGMLVIPGSGVASAEDMQEAGQGDQVVEAAPQAVPPEDQRSPEEVKAELQREAAAGIAKLRADHPEAYRKFTDWTRQRGIGKLDELDATALRGLTTKIKKSLQDAEAETGDEKAPTPHGEAAPGPEAEIAD